MSKESVLNDIRGKIDRERKLIQGFQTLKKTTQNAEVIQRCNNQIRETQSNIDYLQETLAKMSLGDTGDGSDVASHRSPPSYSRFDLIKYDCPSLGHRISYMMQQLQFKLQVENQYRAANEKLSRLYLMDGDKLSSSAAEGGRIESDQRIMLLNKSLKKYQDMHIDVDEVTRDMQVILTPKYARKPLLGKLTVVVTCVRDIDHIALPMFSKRLESYVTIKVDDVELARTRPSRSGKWNEEFRIDVDKGNEVEFAVYDKAGSQAVPVAFAWALLSDITEELRKRKVEMGSAGWVSGNDFTPSSGSVPSSSGTGSVGSNNAAFNQTGPTVGSGQSGALSTSLVGGSSPSSDKPIQISAWINLEPTGQILLTFSFDKSNRTNKQFMGGLGRHGAIRQKKEEVFEQHGHRFVQKQFYNIMCCALCGEFLRYTGFQCQDCRFLCHKKCYQKVVTKCISISSADVDPDEAKLNHRIPHRFEPTLNRGTKWCCHCGYILPWGRKNVRKCTECGVMCHANCTHLVPDFCGMSMEMANKILTTIKSTKPRPKQPATKEYPKLPKQDGASSITKVPSIPSMESESREKLPTQSSNAYQAPVDAPNQRPVARRPPPPVPVEDRGDSDSYSSGLQQPDFTYDISQSDLQPEPKDDFTNFDYGNEKSSVLQQGAPSIQETYNTRGEQQAVINRAADNKHYQPEDGRDVHAHISPETRSPMKTKKRRRKIGLDDFQFLAVLGKGNFGKVMLAESRQTQTLCAIKVLKKDFIVENDEAESVKSEKRVFLTANKAMHPFLLNLHCCFQTENRIYFVMEYISGGDLMWHIQKSRFSAKRAKFYACEVLLALKYFHENGIVYRDIKLDNILLTTKGHIKIGDYGLCKENMWQGNTTATFCGTPEFMAPEIISGKQYDRAVDWWALGVLLFQMLLCQSPFKGDDEDEIFNAIEHDDVRYPINMPRQTVLVLQALLTKDPLSRLGSGPRDAEEIMDHPYFSDVNFDDILNLRVQPPYIPEITSEHDYSNFDKEFTSETPRLTPVDTVLTSEMQEQFRGFSHISDDAAI
ncbi:hypothetical protein QFC19_008798 [Naganishia cerealis]|uniref:Uncharacterized protein n=1 Tax=Naganishia cerealis TaxID=610337 RepID=A0ACC2UYI5_9TREE|nr:hypothetical protein QFC19_008798 [Naganishia cerealis]